MGYQHCQYCWFFKTTWEDFISSANRYVHAYITAFCVIHCRLLSVTHTHTHTCVCSSFTLVYLWILWKEPPCASEWIHECWVFKLQAVLSIYCRVLGFIYIYALLIPFVFNTAVMATGLIWSRYSTVITPVSFFFLSKTVTFD